LICKVPGYEKPEAALTGAAFCFLLPQRIRCGDHKDRDAGKARTKKNNIDG